VKRSVILDATLLKMKIHEALQDLSRRPQPDLTGALQHALAALECLARDVTGENKPTLGQLMRDIRS